MATRSSYKNLNITLLSLTVIFSSSCSTFKNWFGVNTRQAARPIANPFADYRYGSRESQPMILRTKKGDRSVELELPGDSNRLSEFVLPVSPAFRATDKNSTRSIASDGGTTPEGIDSTESNYKTHNPTPSDREIVRSFSQGSAENDEKRRDVEKSLNLAQSDDDLFSENEPSYLAQLDYIKQLYRSGRYEAALLETEDMIKRYQTDPKLFEMRGTLLDRMGRRELAIVSWNQALRFNPNNQSLKKFLERKQALLKSGVP